MNKLINKSIFLIIIMFGFYLNVSAETLPSAKDGKVILEKDYTIEATTINSASSINTIDLNGKVLTINGTLTISKKLEIKNGTIIRNASNTAGSIIEITSGNNGDVSINNVIIDGNKTYITKSASNGVGHAVSIRKDSTVILNNVKIKNNYTQNVVGTGAVYSQQAKSVIIKNSEIYENKSSANCGVAVYADGGANVEIINTKIYNNSTTISGVLNILNVENFVFDKDSIVKDNEASAAGGIRLLNTNAIISGTIQGNKSTSDNGGGLYTLFDNDLYNDRTVKITKTAKIINNKSANAGGGLYVNASTKNIPGKVIIDGATFEGNRAMGTTDESAGLLKGVGGGAIAVARGILEINDVKINNNTSNINKGNSIIVSHANGNTNGGKLTINDGIFDDSIDLGVGSIVVNGGTFKYDMASYITNNKLVSKKTDKGYEVVIAPVTIESIKLIENSESLNISNSQNIDVTFNDLDQFVKYEVVLKNNTNKNLLVTDLSADNLSDDFIHYVLDDKSVGKKILAGKTEKVIVYIKTLEIEGAGKNLNDNINLKFMFSESITNPATLNNKMEIILSIILISLVIFICFYKRNKNVTTCIISISLILLGVTSVLADDIVTITLNGTVSYSSQNLMEESGNKIKGYSVDYTNSKDIWKYYDKVKYIKISSLSKFEEEYETEFDITIGEKNRVKAYLVKSDAADMYDLYITSRGVIYAPSDATALFSFPKVEKIDGLENIVFENTKIFTGMFMENKELTNVNAASIDFSNAEDTSYMFTRCYKVEVEQESLEIPTEAKSDKMFVEFIYDKMKKNAINDKNVDFSATPSVGNYMVEGTQNDEFPIYYYRGAVTNNNVIFANYCWKIVRTTETGGIKLVYNGVPSEKGSCNNTGDASQIGKSSYNPGDSSTGFDYETSIIKNTIDTWYKNNMKNYTSLLEDTIWCNEREIAGEVQGMTYFTSRERVALVSFHPTTQCKRTEDRLTVSSKKLTYPVGLLTADELTYAGTGWSGYSTTSYLNTGIYWWTMSPYRYDGQVGSGKYNVFLANTGNGKLYYAKIHNQLGVRPAISLKVGTGYDSGDGTVDNPYIIK